MNNNDTNFNGSNGMNPNPMGFDPNQNNLNPVGPNPMNNNSNNMQGTSLGSLNPEPTVVAQPTLEPVQPVSEPTVNLLDPNPVPNSAPVSPSPVANSMDSLDSMVSSEPQMPTNNGAVGVVPNIPMQTPEQPQSLNVVPTVMDQTAMNQMNSPMANPTPTMAPVDMVENGMNPSVTATSSPMGFQPADPMNSSAPTPNMGMDSNMNNNNIFGAVPTPPDMNSQGQNDKKAGGKFKLSKQTIIILAVLLVLIIGCGVYLVLTKANSSKSKGSITTKDLVMELGSSLSDEVADYATISGYSGCSVDISKINVNKMGSYEFTVTCGTDSKVGTIILQDKTAPVVVTREVMVVPGSSVSIEDFIVVCDDYTECSYELDEDSPTLEEMAAIVGEYSIPVIVSDEYDNQSEVDLTLIVSDSAPVRHMYCTPAPSIDDELNANLEVTYKYGINGDEMLAQTERTYFYTFDEEEDYLEAKANYKKNSFDGLLGQAIFDDDEFSITLITYPSEEELAIDFDVDTFPTDYASLRSLQVDELGISCKNR